MTFRMKKVHYTGCNRGGLYRESVRPVPGCRLYKQRLEYYEAGDSMTSKQRAAQNRKFEKEKNQNAPAAITLTLKHGDILIMHGAPIQTYYEVSMIPNLLHTVYFHTQKLTFFLTACGTTKRKAALCAYLQIH